MSEQAGDGQGGLRVLDLCSGSGNWSLPYRQAGYEVVQVDLPCDVRFLHFPGKVHGILAAPPCTVFAGSGARWPRTREQMLEGLSIVDACLRLVAMCEPEWWCLENPVGKLVRWLGKPQMYFQPWEYGDPYTKKTCLWGNFNEPKRTLVLPLDGGKIHRMAPGPTRTAERSKTPLGFARAFFEANP